MAYKLIVTKHADELYDIVSYGNEFCDGSGYIPSVGKLLEETINDIKKIYLQGQPCEFS